MLPCNVTIRQLESGEIKAAAIEVETRHLNQAVKRNIDRFPEMFRFQLSEKEFDDWKSQIVMSEHWTVSEIY